MNGANAAGLVGLDDGPEIADATVLGHKTEGSDVKDPVSSYEIAKSRLVPLLSQLQLRSRQRPDLQCMEGGALGVDGADAAGPVGKDYRSKNANVTVQGHKMEGGNVKDSVSSHGNVKSGIAPCMEAGALGVNGADAPRLVGQDHRPKNADATVPDRQVAAGNVKDLVSRPGLAA